MFSVLQFYIWKRTIDMFYLCVNVSLSLSLSPICNSFGNENNRFEFKIGLTKVKLGDKIEGHSIFKLKTGTASLVSHPSGEKENLIWKHVHQRASVTYNTRFYTYFTKNIPETHHHHQRQWQPATPPTRYTRIIRVEYFKQLNYH